ncbi:carboxypeptidase S [Zopfochytrium polystomum]|nr:carboxypeptidase S [Zopfochytrium polystomum]
MLRMHAPESHTAFYPSCPQPPLLVPTPNANLSLDRLDDPKYRGAAAERFAGALRINTVSFDKWRGVIPPAGDPEHAGFLKLHKYFEAQFPLVHSTLEKVVIADYSLLYVWKGSDESLPALLLCSHQDVVPVLEATANQWLHEPFSGDIEDGWIWGRGAADTKATLVGVLESIEMLIKGGFKPKKTVLLAFGHDEEISGIVGAKNISAELVERGYAGNIGMLVDEGTGVRDSFGIRVASIAIGEKGYVDTQLTIETPGGHASMPPRHTGIGLMSKIIDYVESNPFPPALTDENPFLGAMVCAAEHNPDGLDPYVKWAITHLDYARSGLARYLDSKRETRVFVSTTQAVDIINGGIKVNALPEVVSAFINHRIAIDSSVAKTEAYLAHRLALVANWNKINLTVYASSGDEFTLNAGPDAVGVLTMRSSVGALEPAPISPVGDLAWNVLSGTIFHTLSSEDDSKMIVAPMLMPANTDTRHYWDLTRNIYRFGPVIDGEGIHTVNERTTVESYIKTVKFYHELVRNWDEA